MTSHELTNELCGKDVSEIDGYKDIAIASHLLVAYASLDGYYAFFGAGYRYDDVQISASKVSDIWVLNSNRPALLFPYMNNGKLFGVGLVIETTAAKPSPWDSRTNWRHT